MRIISFATLIACLFAAMYPLIPVYGGQAERKLRISGSSTIQPIAEAIAELYKKKYGKSAFVRGGGSVSGMRDVLSNSSDIGAVSRALEDHEKSRLGFTTIGFDAVAIIVNTRNPLRNVSRDALISIYKGEVRNWKGISGWEQPIVVVSKQPGRSTLELFENYTGLKHSSEIRQGERGYITKDSHEVGSNLEGATLVGGIPGAVGYISVGTAMKLVEKGMPIKVLDLNGVRATGEKVKDGTYPIIRELNFVYRKGDEGVRGFFDLALSPQGQKVLVDLGFIPAKQDGASQ